MGKYKEILVTKNFYVVLIHIWWLFADRLIFILYVFVLFYNQGTSHVYNLSVRQAVANMYQPKSHLN